MSKEALYSSRKFQEEAKSRELSVEIVSRYAQQLAHDSSVISDLKHAHEANSEDYSEDEYADLGAVVSQFIDRFIESEGYEVYENRISGRFDALIDFNGWYLEKVVYGDLDFDSALSEYIKKSPFILGGQL